MRRLRRSRLAIRFLLLDIRNRSLDLILRLNHPVRQLLLLRHLHTSLRLIQRLSGTLILPRRLLPDHTIRRNLPEHIHRIKPRANSLELHFIVDRSDSHALDVDGPAVRLGSDFLALVVEADVVVLHDTPVAPAETDGWRAAVDFEDFPGEGGHHAFEGLVRGGEVGVVGVVVLVGRDDRVVGSDLVLVSL